MARWTSTLLAAALLGVALAPPSGAQSHVAAAATSFTVTANLAPHEIVLGQRATLSGTVSPVRTGVAVKIQRKVPSGWVTIAERPMDENGVYRQRLRPGKVGTYIYRARMPRVGAIAAASSRWRKLTVVEDPTVAFTIAPGTGASSWNTSGTPVTAEVGETLRITNGDSVPHRPHTDGQPFPHPGTDIGPGQSAEYVLEAAFSGALYCHIHGTGSQFWLTVAAPAG